MKMYFVRNVAVSSLLLICSCYIQENLNVAPLANPIERKVDSVA